MVVRPAMMRSLETGGRAEGGRDENVRLGWTASRISTSEGQHNLEKNQNAAR